MTRTTRPGFTEFAKGPYVSAHPTSDNPAMTTDLDIWRAAKLLIDRHGEKATTEAMKRADALAAQGDTEGKVVWLRILEAIEELQNTAPSGAVH